MIEEKEGWIVVRFPSDEEQQQSARFQTYVNYLTALDSFLDSTYGDGQDLARMIAGSNTAKRIQGGRCRDQDALQKLLRNAWFTEIQMHISAPHDDLLPYSNHWAPVQLYYAVYLAVRAYLCASGQQTNPTHAATLASMGREVSSRPQLFPPPWGITCTGDPDGDGVAYENLPDDVSIEYVSSLSTGDQVSFYDSYGMFLRTTRRRQIDARIDQWKKDNDRKRIRRNERADLVERVPPTTLWQVLYRLRTRANYLDADSVLLTLDQPEGAKRFNYGLRKLAWHTLLILELLIARYVGRRRFGELVAGFTQYDRGSHGEELVVARWAVVEDAVRAAAL